MKKKIIIAGGGTGGHIYPGIALARAAQEKGFEAYFVGSTKGLESTLVKREGIPLYLLPVGKLHRSAGWVARLKTLLFLPICFCLALYLLIRLRPQAVLGVGGFASGPMVLLASLVGIRTAIWEPNAMPGLTNRWLARFVDEFFLVMPDAARHLPNKKTTPCGMPVRKEILATDQKSLRRNDSNFHLFIFGGSQGARSLNAIVTKAILEPGPWSDGLSIIHQTGPLDYEIAKQACARSPHVEVVSYVHNMPEILQWADLVMCRAGAATISELAATGKPAVFIPLPWAADDHQRQNAQTLVNASAAALIEQKDFTVEVFKQVVDKYKKDPENLKRMSQNIRKFYRPNAANEIIERFLSRVI